MSLAHYLDIVDDHQIVRRDFGHGLGPAGAAAGGAAAVASAVAAASLDVPAGSGVDHGGPALVGAFSFDGARH
ncbi:hypothetical protein V6N11_078781 [Hibiscus sabdariffa]|uniref:Uncharacterized protein n=1 Tax=Hibiscus sabdariffa TaxID=183260 RepID=A0ABR2RU56_9ROSI